jgi:hypothetical protein
MTRHTYTVTRRPGGWAVETDDQMLCCFRTLEQAIAQARELGRAGWREHGEPAEVQVLGVTGLIRTEVVYGLEHLPG